MSLERPLPKPPRSRLAAIALGFTALAAASTVWAVRVDSLAPLWLMAAGLAAILFAWYYRRRCPQCGRRLQYRAEPLYPVPGRHRVLFDCRHCNVVWDSGEIAQETS
jgi:hypothetical protein